MVVYIPAESVFVIFIGSQYFSQHLNPMAEVSISVTLKLNHTKIMNQKKGQENMSVSIRMMIDSVQE